MCGRVSRKTNKPFHYSLCICLILPQSSLQNSCFPPASSQTVSLLLYRWGHFIMTHFTWKMFFHYRFKPDHIMRWRKVLLIWVGNAFVSPSFSELSFEGVYAKRDCNCFEFIWEKRAPMCFSFWVTPKERLLSFGVNKWDVLCHTVCFCFCNQPNPFKHVGELLFST